jgi:hypothetical protein
MKLNSFSEQAARLFHERKIKIEPVAFHEVNRGIKSCLVCMPGKLDLIKPAAEILPEIATAFPNRSLKVMLTSSIDPQSHDFIKRFIVIRAEPGDYDTFSLPKKQFITRISSGGVGIAIDLDPRPNLFNAVAVLRSGALVRTSFDKGIGLPYYNMIVGSQGHDPASRAAYRMMADVLANFRMQ